MSARSRATEDRVNEKVNGESDSYFLLGFVVKLAYLVIALSEYFIPFAVAIASRSSGRLRKE